MVCSSTGVSDSFQTHILFRDAARDSCPRKRAIQSSAKPERGLAVSILRAYGQASVESCATDNPCFVLRNGGYFIQDVNIFQTRLDGTLFWLLARQQNVCSRQWLNHRLPSLYGYMMDAGEPRGGRVLAYLQEQNMSPLNVPRTNGSRCGESFRYRRYGAHSRFPEAALANGTPHNGRQPTLTT